MNARDPNLPLQRDALGVGATGDRHVSVQRLHERHARLQHHREPTPEPGDGDFGRQLAEHRQLQLDRVDHASHSLGVLVRAPPEGTADHEASWRLAAGGEQRSGPGGLRTRATGL